MNNTTDWAAIAQKLHQDCRALESKLAEVTKQRDELVDALETLFHYYSLTSAGYDFVEEALAAVKGGSHE